MNEQESESGEQSKFSHRELAAELLEKEEIETTPERVSDQELGQLVSAVGNHEAKAIIFLAMAEHPRKDFGRSDLARAFRNTQGEDLVWKGNISLGFDYCKDSFAPIGLVAKEEITGQGARYTVTEKGMELGVPLAGHLLKFSSEHKESLKEVFGLTHSKTADKRSPDRRIEILRELLTNELPINLASLYSSVEQGSRNTVRNQLQQLEQVGLIQIDATSAKGLKPSYEFPETITEYEPRFEQPGLSKAVADSINSLLAKQEGVELTTESIVNDVIEQNSTYSEQKSLRSNVNYILTGFRDQGLAIPTYNLQELSDISIEPESRETLQEALNILENFSTRKETFLAEGKALAHDIISNPEMVRQLVAKAAVASPEANRFPQEDQNIMVLGLLGGSPRSFNEIMQSVEAPAGLRLTGRMVKDTLFRLRKAGKILSQKSKGENLWYSNPEGPAESF